MTADTVHIRSRCLDDLVKHHATSSICTTSRLPRTSKAASIRESLVARLGSSMRRTSFSSQCRRRANSDLESPDSRNATYSAAFAAVWAGMATQ